MAILNVMQGYNISKEKMQDPEYQVQTYHRLLEAMKFSYAERNRLGDMDFVKEALGIARHITSPNFGSYVRSMSTEKAHPDIAYYQQESKHAVPEDHGTSHVSVLDEDGNAVSITTTVNLYFGARVRSMSTGIIWNDEMDDFSNPNASNYFGFAPTPANYIEPRKRPLSSMSPMIVFDKDNGDVRIVAGSAGGSRIITATAQLVMRLLWFGQNVREAIESPRLHHQLIPFYSEYEPGFPRPILQKLIDRGQNFSTMGTFSTAATAIFRSSDGRIYANSDYRKAGGYPSGF
jgi:gamma-glutamyltranspeptidase/glutathione hydrolase/leukotriene-C4 hydrolase